MAHQDRDLETASYDSKPGGSQYTSTSGTEHDAPIPPPPPAYMPRRTLRDSPPRTQKKWLTLPSIGYVGHFRLSPVYEKPNHSYPARIFGIRRRWFLGGLGLLCLLIFIIGLAAGLSARKSRPFLPLPGTSEKFTGEATFYDTGLGACGWTNDAGESVVAISHLLWDAESVGSNPNSNPFCGKKVRATRYRPNNEAYLIGQDDEDKPGGRNVSIDAVVVDRCTGCKPTDLDFSRSAFDILADQAMGRVSIEWTWL